MVPVPSPSPSPGTRGLVAPDDPLNYMMTPRNSMSITHTKGLLNMPGQNNCFLNSAVQVLWHLDIFRRSFRQLTGHTCMAESCIFCALKELFTQFQYSQESALPPDALRRALAETFCDQRRFQLGFMDDAAECFENILQRIHFHIASQQSEDMCNVAHCIPHQKFAMILIEQTCCHACGATSEPLPFTQMVHYVSASALCSQSTAMKQENNKYTFGDLLKRAGGMGDIRACPSSCGAKIQIRRVLINQPEIVSIGMVWDSERPTLEHIMEVFQTIGIVMQLNDVFHSVVDSKWAKATTHQLVGVVTYYGKHYSTFFFHTKLRVWIYFDDATVREIGPSWDQVVEKCRRGHFQPLLLLYANPGGTPVMTSTAPRTVTMANGHKKNLGKQMVEASPVHVTEQHAQTIKLTQLGSVSPRWVISPGASTKDDYPNMKSPTINTSQCGSFPPSNFSLHHHHHANSHIPHKNESHTYTGTQHPCCCVKSCQCHHLYHTDNSSSSVHNCHMTETDCQHLMFHENNHEDQETYISRKAVESVLNFQKLQRQRSLNGVYSGSGSRNSSSSLESFDNSAQKPALKLDIPDGENLSRRRDSGNWSGDRNSASSSSSTSMDNPYMFAIGNKWLHPPSLRHAVSGKPGHDYINVFSDQGYDSFSLSSTDSFPSIGNSPKKLDPRLCQIPESVILNEKRNANKSQNGPLIDCDKLCSEADMLLNKSHEKEREGDMVMAALLSDSAAAKARAAMDAPYSNSRSLVTAKMKHSTCVMRSSCLYRKINEAEAEKRKQRESESGHSRQSSRDSTHGRHSRQGSRDSKHNKSLGDGLDKSKKTIEIYGTLPKKGSTKKDQHFTEKFKDDQQVYKDFLEKQRQCSKQEQQLQVSEKRKQFRTETVVNNRVKSDIDAVISEKNCKVGAFEKSPSLRVTRQKKVPALNHTQRTEKKDSCVNEWENTKRSTLFRTYSGPTSMKDIPGYEVPNQPGKKQHKIKRKLMGGFMRRKNRSLPDLREGQETSDHETRAYDDSAISDTDSRVRKSDDVQLPHISRVSHLPLRAYINKDVHQRPLLTRVSPPQIRAKSSQPILIPFAAVSKVDARDTALAKECSEDELPLPTNNFLAELQEKRKKIMQTKEESKSAPLLPRADTLPKDSYYTNSLLQELQTKQHQMMGKRIQVPQQSAVTSDKQLKEKARKFDRGIATMENKKQDPSHACNTVDVPISICSSDNPSPVGSLKVELQQHKESEVESEIGTEEKPCSVKDLASRFENIFCAKLQQQSPTQANVFRFPNVEKQMCCREEEVCNQQKQNSVEKLSSNNCEDPVSEELVKQKCETVENSAKHVVEARRPVRPPDYETAVQRLYLLRDMAMGDTEAKTSPGLDSKKKTGAKKTVTFSDKVVLVACAEDDSNDYLPNPVFERVYRQHVMQNAIGNNERQLSVDSTSQQQQSFPCHLCHKKFVTAPTIYCPDCSFYMARFQPQQ